MSSVVGNKNLAVILNNKRIYEIDQNGNVEYVGNQKITTDAETIMMKRDVVYLEISIIQR